MLSLVMPRVDRSAVASEKVWHPPVIRTVASENRGVDALAETIAKFRTHFESSGERTKKHTEHWRNHLLELLESRLVERVLNAAGGEAALNQLASDVAERRKDPFAAVNEILAKSGLETPVK
jgi:LAO/AO transport system kinase